MKFISTFNTVFYILLALQVVSIGIAIGLNYLVKKEKLPINQDQLLKYGIVNTIVWIVIVGVAAWNDFAATMTFFAVVSCGATIYGGITYRMATRKYRAELNY